MSWLKAVPLIILSSDHQIYLYGIASSLKRQAQSTSCHCHVWAISFLSTGSPQMVVLPSTSTRFLHTRVLCNAFSVFLWHVSSISERRHSGQTTGIILYPLLISYSCFVCWVQFWPQLPQAQPFKISCHSCEESLILRLASWNRYLHEWAFATL